MRASPVFCRDCGTINQLATDRVAELETTITALGVEVAKKAAQVKRLTKQQSEAHPPEYEDAMEVARYWKAHIAPNTRELNGERLANTISRLKNGYSKQELLRAVWGYSCRPHMKERGARCGRNEGTYRGDLALLMRDAKHVDEGLKIADEEDRFDQSYLADGASRFVAALCDCGHARGSHALPRMHGHEACLEHGCDCREWDDIYWQMESYARKREERLERPAKAKAPQIPAPPASLPLL